MKIEKSSNRFGFTIQPGLNSAGGGESFPQLFDQLETRCKELYGPDALPEIGKAAGLDASSMSSRLTMMIPMSVAIGYALASGNGTKADEALAQAGIARAQAMQPKAAATVQTFPELVRSVAAYRNVTKATAVGICVKDYPQQHAAWLASGNTSAPL